MERAFGLWYRTAAVYPPPGSLTVSCSKVPTRSLGPCRSARMQIGCLYLVSIVRIVLTNYTRYMSRGRHADTQARRQTAGEGQTRQKKKVEINIYIYI